MSLLAGTLLFFVCNCFGLDIKLLPSAKAWGCAIGLLLFPTIISMVLVTSAIHIIGSTPASIIGALEPITALIISLAVFGGVINWLNCLDFIMVLGAVLLMVVWKR